MSVLRLALFELRRMTRGRLPRAALAVLTIVPLLCALLPVRVLGSLREVDRIPVALVNADRPATAGDGSEVHAGRDLTEKLLDRKVFGWTVTDQADATKGLRDGRYHLVFHPGGLLRHARRRSGTGPPGPAGRAEGRQRRRHQLPLRPARQVGVQRDPAAAAQSTAATYFDKMLIGFTDAKAETGRAADGAGRIADGLGSSQQGAGRIADGLGDAEDGAGQLAGGLNQSVQGADKLAKGLDQLDRRRPARRRRRPRRHRDQGRRGHRERRRRQVRAGAAPQRRQDREGGHARRRRRAAARRRAGRAAGQGRRGGRYRRGDPRPARRGREGTPSWPTTPTSPPPARPPTGPSRRPAPWWPRWTRPTWPRCASR
ncbi:hypothetical protein V2I01_22955 [Micromonospora sp. BRA006-A]|nr:hypothetical protein [Micromonospora sp. BRA006-A]